MRQFSIISSAFLASLIGGGCSDSHRAKSPNDLADDEIRGRVVSTDLNKSLISVWDETKGAEYLYTRGGLGIPRGLFIGSSDSSAFIPSSTLQVWLAPQSKKEF